MGRERTEAHTWLGESFAQFVAELHKQRRRVENAAPETTAFGKAATAEGVAFDSVQRELKRLLEDLDAEASAYMRPEAFKRAHYAMAVLADEIFMRHMAEWDGAALWQQHPLEVEIFGTQDAATLFYKKADETIQSTDRADAAVAEIFYYAISLGFEGMLDQKERTDYMRKLAIRFGRTPRRTTEISKLIPQAYGNLHVESRGGLLPAMWKAIAVLAAVVLISIVALTVTYRQSTSAISDKCGTIIDQARKVHEQAEATQAAYQGSSSATPQSSLPPSPEKKQ